MIKAILLTAAVIAAGPALAQTTATDGSSQSDFPVTGDVPDQCLIGDPGLAAGAPAINIRSTSGQVVSIDELANAESLSSNGTDVTLSFDAVCNFPYRVTLTSQNNGLWRQSTATPTPVGFANAVPYLAEIAWDESSAMLDADARSRQPKDAGFAPGQPSASGLSLRLRVLPRTTNVTANAPLVAGDYRDVLTITLGPQ